MRNRNAGESKTTSLKRMLLSNARTLTRLGYSETSGAKLSGRQRVRQLESPSPAMRAELRQITKGVSKMQLRTGILGRYF